ncbi:MAG: exo-alpha-sialidase [Lentisphaeria bacterium]|nr:exo-alpha-sialidase [Lentisphaeria bacterium]
MLKVIKHITVYQDEYWYSAFPGAAALENGRIALCFRRAPRYRGLPGLKPGWYSHLDPNSKLMITFSEDNGENWSEPELLLAPYEGCAQDGGMFYDGKYLFANTFIWGNIPRFAVEALDADGNNEFIYAGNMVPTSTHIGSISMRSSDGGRSWEKPVFPEPLPGGMESLPGRPLMMHNRANIIRSADGRLFYCGQALRYRPEYHSSVVLYESRDDGQSWQFLSTVADHKGSGVFEEPFLYITPSGKFVMLMRTHRAPGGEKITRANCFVAESTDGGRSWSEPVDTGIHMEPPCACRLADNRVLVAYGYRIEPETGVRARICDPELTNLTEAEEIIIRNDGERADTGYPQIVPLGGNRYMIFYYMNPLRDEGRENGIYGTVVEVE